MIKVWFIFDSSFRLNGIIQIWIIYLNIITGSDLLKELLPVTK